jgi:hypothetical protein
MDDGWEPIRIGDVTREYRDAIGAVVVALAQCDYGLHQMFQSLTGLDREQVHIILKDLSSSEVHSLVKRLTDHKKDELWGYDGRCETLAALQKCREKRNRYSHWIWQKAEDSFKLYKVGLSETIPHKDVTLEEIRETASELGKLFLLLALYCRSQDNAQMWWGQFADAVDAHFGIKPPESE